MAPSPSCRATRGSVQRAPTARRGTRQRVRTTRCVRIGLAGRVVGMAALGSCADPARGGRRLRDGLATRHRLHERRGGCHVPGPPAARRGQLALPVPAGVAGRLDRGPPVHQGRCRLQGHLAVRQASGLPGAAVAGRRRHRRRSGPLGRRDRRRCGDGGAARPPALGEHLVAVAALWLTGLATPLLFDAGLLLAHTLAAAAFGGGGAHGLALDGGGPRRWAWLAGALVPRSRRRCSGPRASSPSLGLAVGVVVVMRTRWSLVVGGAGRVAAAVSCSIGGSSRSSSACPAPCRGTRSRPGSSVDGTAST